MCTAEGKILLTSACLRLPACPIPCLFVTTAASPLKTIGTEPKQRCHDLVCVKDHYRGAPASKLHSTGQGSPQAIRFNHDPRGQPGVAVVATMFTAWSLPAWTSGQTCTSHMAVLSNAPITDGPSVLHSLHEQHPSLYTCGSLQWDKQPYRQNRLVV